MSKKAIKEKEPKVNKMVVYNTVGNKVEELPAIFEGAGNHQAALAQAINMYLANKRNGLASTKTRGEVSGGGKKPWKQKGTGRARVGSSRNPLWRHGGVVFGPHPRDYRYTIPAKIKNIALAQALHEKSSQGDIIVLDDLKLSAPKTKEIKKILDNLKVKEKALLVTASFEGNIRLAVRNMAGLGYAQARELNALDVLNKKKLILLKDTIKILSQRLNINNNR